MVILVSPRVRRKRRKSAPFCAKVCNAAAGGAGVPASGDVAAVTSSGTGYIMYTVQRPQSRFGADGGSSGSFIAVFYNAAEDTWYYDNGTTVAAFTPSPTDVLVATVDFADQSAAPVSLYGEMTSVHGIDAGYGGASDTLSYASGGASGPFEVSGTSFVENDLKRVTLEGYNWQDENTWTLVNDVTGDGGAVGTSGRWTFTYNTFDNLGDVTDVTRYYDPDQLIPSDTSAPSDSSLVVIGRAGRRSTIWATSTRASATTRRARPPSSPTPGSTATAMSSARKPAARRNGPRRFTTDWATRSTRTTARAAARTTPTSPAAMDKSTSTATDVLTQTADEYDNAGDQTFETDYNRLPGDTATAALTTSDAQVTYTADWVDGVGRNVAEADFGTNNGTAMMATCQARRRRGAPLITNGKTRPARP